MREREEGQGGGKGKGEEKGREGTLKGWLTPPMFQILKNTLILDIPMPTAGCYDRPAYNMVMQYPESDVRR